MTDQPDAPGPPLSYQRDIRPLFRDKDRNAMVQLFDLWSHQDVVSHQDAIVAQLAAGTMPCDGPWPPEQVAVFTRWVTGGSNP